MFQPGFFSFLLLLIIDKNCGMWDMEFSEAEELRRSEGKSQIPFVSRSLDPSSLLTLTFIFLSNPLPPTITALLHPAVVATCE